MILERDLRLEISRATLGGCVLNVGELLIPLSFFVFIGKQARNSALDISRGSCDSLPVNVQSD
jgi:hypothetical protein